MVGEPHRSEGRAGLDYLAAAQWSVEMGADPDPAGPAHPYQASRGGVPLPWPSSRPDPGARGAVVLARLLRDSYGLSRLQWRAPAEPVWGRRRSAPAMRPVPSGGGQYPCDLYLETGGGDGIAAGRYAYDPVHHRLAPLHLDGGVVGTGCRVYVVVALDRNVGRYGDFGYRLHCLDAGALVGQVVASASGLGWRSAVRYHFPDAALASRLDLDPEREAVYAVVDIGRSPSTMEEMGSAATRTGGRGRPVAWRTDAPARLHAAAVRSDPQWSLRPVPSRPGLVDPDRMVALPEPDASAVAATVQRRSCVGYFSSAAIDARVLATVLAAAGAGVDSDIDGRPVTVLCVVNRVAGLTPGAYAYDPDRHAVGSLRAGDLRWAVQASLTPFVDAARAAAAVVMVTDFATVVGVRGDRWVRILNMEAGVAVQRVYRAAAAHGLACQALCAFDPDRVGTLFGVAPAVLTPQIVVLVGGRRAVGSRLDLPLWDESES
jgi:SagB-type dehydrogenase family enzyme